MFSPTLTEVKTLSSQYNVIPVSFDVYADLETPISLFKRFSENKYCFLLESVEGGEKWARYSFIGSNPFMIVTSGNKTTVIERFAHNGEASSKETVVGNPVEIIKNLMFKYKGAEIAGMPRFNGGAVGFFGYDLIRHYEKLPNVPEDDLKLPECNFMFTDEVIVYDHLMQKIKIIVNLHIDGNIERAYNSVVERIKAIYREINNSRWKMNTITFKDNEQKSKFEYTSNFTKEQFEQNVLKAKEYIRNGDIFQVVLSQRLCGVVDSDPLDVYRALRIINPSPYMYFLKMNHYTLAGSSPEMLVRVEGDSLETCPIAGTRPRGKDTADDERMEKDLLSDEKELAEHIMLVDLGRNDLGKVSKFGTVVVKNQAHIERYSHVMHIVTNVTGTRQESKSAFDALMSVLPAGTVSGAPKVRAMEIIDELENVKRGPYAGAIGYLSFNGNLDSCITIRTMIFKDKKVYIQAGAGIVADSVPENEYLETINKAMAMLKALEEAKDIK